MNDELRSAVPDNTQRSRSPLDPLVAIAAASTTLVIALASGALHRYSLLPHLSHEGTYQRSGGDTQRGGTHSQPNRGKAGAPTMDTPSPPQARTLALNCDGSQLAIVDVNGLLTVFDFSARGGAGAEATLPRERPREPPEASPEELCEGGVRGAGGGGVRVEGAALAAESPRGRFERRDVWGVLWASDEADTLCVMEKGRLVVFKGLTPHGNPIPSSAHLCAISELEITSARLDILVASVACPLAAAAAAAEAAAAPLAVEASLAAEEAPLRPPPSNAANAIVRFEMDTLREVDCAPPPPDVPTAPRPPYISPRPPRPPLFLPLIFRTYPLP